MKRMYRLLAALAFCLVAAAPAMAQDRLYIGFGAGKFTHEVDLFGFTDKGTSTGYVIKIGSDMNEYVAFETRFVGTDRASVAGFAASMDTSMYSIFLKGKIPLAEPLYLYGLAGYTSGSSQTSGGIVGTANRADISYGGGIGIRSDAWDFTAEWVRYWNKVDVGSGLLLTIDGITANLSYSF